MSQRRRWVAECVRKIEADFQRSADTHLIPVAVPGFPDIDFYLKDESNHPSGSLKHRLARSLFLYALCNGWLREGAPVVESSSGSTAVSEAYFARLLGLPFVAVMPATVSATKREAIAFYGGHCHLVEDPTQVYAEAERLARNSGGHYMDQFTYAERATDWRGNNNIAESIFAQMARERHPTPAWLVCSAGTGGTLATLGRFVRYGRHATRVCGGDAERSVFFDHYQTRDPNLTLDCGSRIEGIGRPRVESSFLPDVIDAMVKVPDAWSVAAMTALSQRLGRPVGPSTGTNWIAALACAAEMVSRGEQGSIVTLLCDSGERYRHSYHDAHWCEAQGISGAAFTESVSVWMDRGAALPADLKSAWRLGGALAQQEGA
ncbi:PLP-dependent cysteine synthase family protein [Inhella gelatinilytica]|uniref:L-cysteine desulfhydrase Cds1 n=1 Tax=Inhella gelatinilytica TaxID=2795030 RepID=A0A931IU62_9BURK|nr:PLP-dependent cysteine synthase family protein [Inhella gelatinilytica]MBH9552805.1 PLP-dependent cysteine synthase family protein [Inhella gelatinilytica]